MRNILFEEMTVCYHSHTMKIKYFVTLMIHCWFFTQEPKISLAEKITYKPNPHFMLSESRTYSQCACSVTLHLEPSMVSTLNQVKII